MFRVGLAVAALVALSAPLSNAAVLDFTGNICGGPCSSGRLIDANYGSIAGLVTVSYAGGSVATPDQLAYWASSYSGMFDVAYSPTNGVAEIFLQPADGFSVTLTSFQLGGWPNSSKASQASVLDGLGASLFASGPITILGSTPSTFTGPWTSAAGIRIQFGPESFNAGIDNVVFDVAATPPVVDPGPAPIPLPAPAVLLAAALAGLGVVRRRTA